jgi:hypothetical protein
MITVVHTVLMLLPAMAHTAVPALLALLVVLTALLLHPTTVVPAQLVETAHMVVLLLLALPVVLMALLLHPTMVALLPLVVPGLPTVQWAVPCQRLLARVDTMIWNTATLDMAMARCSLPMEPAAVLAPLMDK